MPDKCVSQQGIENLLKGLNPHKAAGPDKFKNIVLHKELAPIPEQRTFSHHRDPLTLLKNLPSIWKEANVSLILKKGDKKVQVSKDQDKAQS